VIISKFNELGLKGAHFSDEEHPSPPVFMVSQKRPVKIELTCISKTNSAFPP
jgi:hypothetical protein